MNNCEVTEIFESATSKREIRSFGGIKEWKY